MKAAIQELQYVNNDMNDKIRSQLEQIQFMEREKENFTKAIAEKSYKSEELLS